MNINDFVELEKTKYNVGDLRVQKVIIDKTKRLISLYFISDIAVDYNLLNDIKRDIIGVMDFTPFTFNIECRKSIADAYDTKKCISEYLFSRYVSVASFALEKEMDIVVNGRDIDYKLYIPDRIVDFIEDKEVIDNLCNYLSSNFCNNFMGGYEIIENYESHVIEKDNVVKRKKYVDTNRYFKMDAVSKYCDSEVYDTAIYIADGKTIIGDMIFAGVVKNIESKTSKAGRDYYLVTLDDLTGTIEGRFFTNDKAKKKKMDTLMKGSVVIMRGTNSEREDGSISYRIRGINLAEFKANQPIEEKPSKEVPDEYRLVFPTKADVEKKGNLFDSEVYPPLNMKGKTFAVIDIETTGTDILNDKITEIGGVKIIDGVIVDEFTTLINPEVPISEKITKLTGIDDDMVKSCPTIAEVYPDFFKFVSDTIFVAHNTSFDFGFLTKMGKDIGYILKNKTWDTWDISRKVVKGLKNYKLNTVCEHYGIEFHHHRAMSDAFATAELLIEMMRTIENDKIDIDVDSFENGDRIE